MKAALDPLGLLALAASLPDVEPHQQISGARFGPTPVRVLVGGVEVPHVMAISTAGATLPRSIQVAGYCPECGEAHAVVDVELVGADQFGIAVYSDGHVLVEHPH